MLYKYLYNKLNTLIPKYNYTMRKIIGKTKDLFQIPPLKVIQFVS